MPSLSGTRLCPQPSNSEKAVIKPYPYLRWHYPINVQDRNEPPTSYNPTTIRRRSADDDPTPKALQDLYISSGHYGLSNCSRPTSTATSYRHHNSSIAKWQEHPFAIRPMPSQPQTIDAGKVDASSVAISLASTTDSVADTVGSCEQDSSSTTLSLLSDLNHGGTAPCAFHNNIRPTNSDANDGAEAQVSASQDAGVYLANDAAPLSERIQHESEDHDDASGSHENDEQAAELSPSLRLDTEFQANLLAAPEDSRYLFLEYYKRTHGDRGIETRSQSEVYWKWDIEKQKWFHKDPGTQSVVWFLG
ncbi:hypothetical protein F4801DRAFT_428845 [Xylaria longipes]|nr:hypothetical protein F4801DRAFT_428845 [Xylaria longipes]